MKIPLSEKALLFMRAVGVIVELGYDQCFPFLVAPNDVYDELANPQCDCPDVWTVDGILVTRREVTIMRASCLAAAVLHGTAAGESERRLLREEINRLSVSNITEACAKIVETLLPSPDDPARDSATELLKSAASKIRGHANRSSNKET